MTFKKKAIDAMARMEEQDCGVARSVIRECRMLVENIPEEQQNACCAAPNYEAMAKKLEEELIRTRQELECAEEVIRNLRSEKERLTGFREAVLRIFTEGDGCCGRL